MRELLLSRLTVIGESHSSWRTTWRRGGSFAKNLRQVSGANESELSPAARLSHLRIPAIKVEPSTALLRGLLASPRPREQLLGQGGGQPRDVLLVAPAVASQGEVGR